MDFLAKCLVSVVLDRAQFFLFISHCVLIMAWVTCIFVISLLGFGLVHIALGYDFECRICMKACMISNVGYALASDFESRLCLKQCMIGEVGLLPKIL